MLSLDWTASETRGRKLGLCEVRKRKCEIFEIKYLLNEAAGAGDEDWVVR